MSSLSQALEWMRAVLFGRRTPGKHTAAYMPPALPRAPRRRSAPDVWRTRLVFARRRRVDRHAWTPYQSQRYGRAEWFVLRDWEAEAAWAAWECAGPLVRPYVDAQCEAPRNSPEGAGVDPWERAQ